MIFIRMFRLHWIMNAVVMAYHLSMSTSPRITQSSFSSKGEGVVWNIWGFA